jgi:hypothetical protein
MVIRIEWRPHGTFFEEVRRLRVISHSDPRRKAASLRLIEREESLPVRVILDRADDDVVDHRNADELRTLPQRLRHSLVLWARRWVTRGMVMHGCDVKSRASNCSIMKKPP